MSLLMWMYDLAREQSPGEDQLDDMLAASGRAGYHAVGLYLEHRFAYASAPWAAGPGALTPDVARRLAEKYKARGLRIIPFLNTLGHMEGFIRAEGGQWLAEGPCEWPGGIQVCPSRPECAAFARGLIDDALAAFDDEWVHIGGDETRQLGQCPACAARVAEAGKGGLYGQYFGDLCRYVIARGRRPGLWADMLLTHPEALAAIPRETVLFDWQYFNRPRETTARLRAAGFDVVCCPSIQTYNSAWCFLNETQRNIDEHAEDAAALGALGVCVTTWEHCYFSQYEATLPVVYAAGRRLRDLVPSRDDPGIEQSRAGQSRARKEAVASDSQPRAAVPQDQSRADQSRARKGAVEAGVPASESPANRGSLWQPLPYGRGSDQCSADEGRLWQPLPYGRGSDRRGSDQCWSDALGAEFGENAAAAADILGNQIPAASQFLKPGTWRQLRDRFVIRQNPFYLWQDWRAEACGPVGDEILRLCDAAVRHLAPGGSIPPDLPGLHFVIELQRVAIAWVHAVEEASRAYASGDLAAAAATLHRARDVLERLRPGLDRAAQNGGSAADPARLDRLKLKVIEVVDRIVRLPRDAAFRPAFETLIHDGYVAGDQAAWRTAR